MLAVTMGDPAGVGGEIAIGAWRALRDGDERFFLIADPDWLRAQPGGAGDLEIAIIGQADEAAARFEAALPVLPIRLASAASPGVPNAANADAITGSIARAARLCLSGAVQGMVTNPIHKAVLQEAGFAYPGHTEYLGALCGTPGREVMMLAGPSLRVVPVTVHLSLRRALQALSTEAILAVARTTLRALREDFGIAAPRLAMAGLNPHAGESGHMGDDEALLIQPAIDALRAEGVAVEGPMPPDTMFTARARGRYDAAICMYHDQALIPIKTLDMERGVNVTLGLRVVRTSPDHGTAFDIAGRGVADPTSLIEAIRLGGTIAAHRASHRVAA